MHSHGACAISAAARSAQVSIGISGFKAQARADIQRA
jgi:hypothetical protein